MKKYYKSYTQDRGAEDINVVKEQLVNAQKELSVKNSEIDFL